MLNFRSRIPVALGAVVFLTTATPTCLAQGFPVAQVVEAVKSEINQARLARSKDDKAYKITSVKVILKTSVKYEGEAGIRLEVPIVESIAGIWGNVGGKLSNTQTISLDLVPSGGPVDVGGSNDLGLVPAINSVKAALRPTPGADFQLTLNKFDFQIECAIVKTAEGGIKFLFIDAAKAEIEDLATQTIMIQMEAYK